MATSTSLCRVSDFCSKAARNEEILLLTAEWSVQTVAVLSDSNDLSSAALLFLSL